MQVSLFTVGKDVELVTAPTSSSIIKGESNVLRYMARRFGLFQSLEQSEIMAASLDELMDSLYFEKYWGSFSIVKLVTTTLEPMLKASPFLGGNQTMSIADLYAFSLATNEKGKWPQAIKDWMKRCEQELSSATQGKTQFFKKKRLFSDFSSSKLKFSRLLTSK